MGTATELVKVRFFREGTKYLFGTINEAFSLVSEAKKSEQIFS